MFTKNELRNIEKHLTDLGETHQIPSEVISDWIYALYRYTDNPLPAERKPQNLLLVEETAEILRVSEKTIYDFFNSGELTRIKLGYRATRIAEADLQRFIDERRVNGSIKRKKRLPNPHSLAQ